MADTKLQNLSSSTSLADTDSVLVISSAGQSKMAVATFGNEIMDAASYETVTPTYLTDDITSGINVRRYGKLVVVSLTFTISDTDNSSLQIAALPAALYSQENTMIAPAGSPFKFKVSTDGTATITHWKKSLTLANMFWYLAAD